jgi:hypothetical protein
MYTGISQALGDQLKRMVEERTGRVGRAIVPFADRSIPQPLSGGGLLPIELLDDLAPCGYAYASALDLTFDPPKPIVEETFLVRDFFGLSGRRGWQGWASLEAVALDDTPIGGGSASEGTVWFHPLVNIGPPCLDSSSSEPSENDSESDDDSDSDVDSSSGRSGSSFLSESNSFSDLSESEFSSGSSKDHAIVPAPWAPGWFTKLCTIESPSVLFVDLQAELLIDRETFVPIDPKFIQVCEPGTMAVLAGSDEPVAVGAKILGDAVRVRLSSYAQPVKVTLLLVAKRRGFLNWRFEMATREEFVANEERLNIGRPRR